MQDATLVLITFNDLAGLRALWPSLPLGEMREVLAVDGGSTDGTLEFFATQGTRVLAQPASSWGAAALRGCQEAHGQFVVFFRPDGNHDPRDVLTLVRRLEAGAELVVASRFLPGAAHREEGHFLRIRARGCQAFTAAANALFGKHAAVSDATNAFRAVRREAMPRLDPSGAGAELAYQLTLRALRQGLVVEEVPTLEGLKHGSGRRRHTLAAGVEHFRALLSEVLSRRDEETSLK